MGLYLLLQYKNFKNCFINSAQLNAATQSVFSWNNNLDWAQE